MNFVAPLKYSVIQMVRTPRVRPEGSTWLEGAGCGQLRAV
jgi:hypothetical protein